MKRPSFQFYPADWLSDMRVRMLPWECRGLYMDLLCYCWREGWIPADGSAIAQLCGCHSLAIIEPCLLLFQPHPSDPSKLIHKRLEEEKMKQDEHRKERSSAGAKGAKARWNKEKPLAGGNDGKAMAKPSVCHSSAIDLPLAKNSSSTATSTSPSQDHLKVVRRAKFVVPTIQEVDEYAATLDPPFTQTLKWMAHYESNGWKVGKNPMKDWKAAIRTWHASDKELHTPYTPPLKKLPWE